MSTARSVDLSLLPSPNVVEALDFETILADMLSDLRARDAVFDTLSESDPAYKVLEVGAFREVLLRQRINDAARAVMLAYASGSDLDQVGANFNVFRLVVDPGDPAAIPPVTEQLESDSDFRQRIQMAVEGQSTAGSRDGYVFHALSADGDVRAVQAVSPTPGDVVVYVLSHSNGGLAGAPLIDKVTAALNHERVRPLTDRVTVLSASVVPYVIDAELIMKPGPDSEVVRALAESALLTFVSASNRIGADIPLSGVLSALHQPGVSRVRLVGDTPEPDAQGLLVSVIDGEAPVCTEVSVVVAGVSHE